MEFHPLASIFPMLEGEAFAALVADIKKHGQREPIWVVPADAPEEHKCYGEGGCNLQAGDGVWHCTTCDHNPAPFENLILDGRNRYRACLELGIEPYTEDYLGDDLAEFVVSLNLHRRHLNESQRMMVAAKLATIEDGVRADRQGAQICAPTQTEAARLLNVSRRGVQTAREVIAEAAPEIVAAVERGDMSVSLAAQVATLPDEDEQLIVELKEDPQRMREVAREAVHNHRAQGTGENEWYTPSEYVEAARTMMGGIDLDPASSDIAQRTVKAGRYFTVQDDGLAQSWSGRVWLNPPYAQPAIANFMNKVVQEADNFSEAIILTHNYTDTAWFHTAASHASAICFTRGRIGFLSPDGKKAAPTQGQAFFYFGDNADRFAECFGAFGLVLFK